MTKKIFLSEMETTMGWAIGVLGGLFLIGWILSRRQDQTINEVDPDWNPYTKKVGSELECCDRLGALAFEKLNGITGKLVPLVSPMRGQQVTCVTPYGVMDGTIGYITDTTATVSVAVEDCTMLDIISLSAVPNYFSLAMAEKLGVGKKAWIVSDIRIHGSDKTYSAGMGRKRPATINQKKTSRWLRDETFFGDFLELMIEELWFELIFGGFLDSVEYYDGLEPIRENDDPTGDVTNWFSEQEREDLVTIEGEMNADSIEDSMPTTVFEDAPAGMPRSVPPEAPVWADPASFDDPPATEVKRDPIPEPTPAPEPAYEPPSRNYGGGGGSFDSSNNDDCGGCDSCDD